MRLHALILILSTAMIFSFSERDAFAKAPKEMKERAISTLLAGAQSADFDTRAMAVEGLGFAPKKRVLAVVKDALADQQWQVRRAVIGALIELKDASWSEAISNAMLSSGLDPTSEVFPLLEPLGPKKALGVMKKAFENPKMPQAHRYVQVLAKKGGAWMTQGFQMGLKLKQKQSREAFQEMIPKLRLPDAAPLYKKILLKQPLSVQKTILARLTSEKNTGDISFIKRLLKSKDADVRFQTAVALARRGNKAGRKLLVSTLAGDDDAAKLLALHGLKHLAGTDLYPHLKQFTKNERTSVELLKATLAIHAALKNAKLAPWLEKMLMGRMVRSIAIQAAAVSVLGKVKGKASLPTLYKLMGHGNSGVRESVARALADLARRESIPHIRTALFKESFPEVKVELIRALAAINSRECIDVLRTEVATPHKGIRTEVVKALSGLRHAQTVPDLEIILRTARDIELRRLAVVAILRLGPTRYVRHFRGALNWLTAHDMRGLTRDHKREMIPHLQEALKSSRPQAREAGLAALEELDTNTRKGLYRRLALQARRPEMRIAGMKASVALEGRQASDLCRGMASDSDKSVRIEAISALGTLGAKDALPLLFNATNDVNERIRVAASTAILKL